MSNNLWILRNIYSQPAYESKISLNRVCKPAIHLHQHSKIPFLLRTWEKYFLKSHFKKLEPNKILKIKKTNKKRFYYKQKNNFLRSLFITPARLLTSQFINKLIIISLFHYFSEDWWKQRKVCTGSQL